MATRIPPISLSISSGTRVQLVAPVHSKLPLECTKLWPVRVQVQHRAAFSSSQLKPKRRRAVKTSRIQAALSKTAVSHVVPAQQFTVGQWCAVVTGYLVLVGSLFRSVPQIMRCVQNRSVTGLSLMSVVSEMVAYLNTTSYSFVQGYAFNTYGDVASCLVQDAVLVGLIFHFGDVKWLWRVLLTVSLVAWGWWLMSGTCGLALLTALQLGTIFILSVFGRLPQIILNIRNGNSGELSLITCLLNVLGSGARVFTTIQLTGDKVILWGTFVQLLLNGILFYQTVQTARQAGKLPLGSTGEASGLDGPQEGMAVKTA